MSRTTRINIALVGAAVVLWLIVRAAAGGVHEALGPNGAAFAGMVRDFTLKGGDKPTRLSPLLPALAWVPYAITHSVAAAFTAVNTLAMAGLAVAACLLLDRRGVDASTKLFATSTFAMTIMAARLVAFEPANPALVALAAVTLALAFDEREWTCAAAAANVAAVMALPIGLVAPAYALARRVRVRIPLTAVALRVWPAVLMWLFVQWWARGGVGGAFADFAPHAMFGSSAQWMRPTVFIPGVYAFVAAAGGLSVMACCAPGAWGRVARQAPELLVLAGCVILYAICVPDNAALACAFLAPLWIALISEWRATVDAPNVWWWVAAGTAVTVATQRPFATIGSAASLTAVAPRDILLVASVALVIGLMRGRSATVPARWSRASAGLSRSSAWMVASYAFAALLAAITAYFLFGMPIQLTDSFGNLLELQGASFARVFLNEVQNGAYFRPLLHLQLKAVYELARGNYFPWFRSVQALQVFAALIMAVRLLRPDRAIDAVLVPCSLAILLGIHTFAGTITEAFPINTFLTIVLCCLAAANLSASSGGWWTDVLASLLLAFSLLTLESGVLVWLIFVAAYVVGSRGLSTRGVAGSTAVLVAYFAARLLLLHSAAAPGLDERATGFGFHVLQPPEVVARFGSHPLPLYIYNVASAILTVLFAEPRGGVWQFTAGLSTGSVEPWMVVNVVTSTFTTGVLGWYIARRVPAWRRRLFTDGDRLVLIFLVILPFNALLCAVYVKDVIMSPAGVFYALAATVALRDLVETSRTMTGLVPVWTIVILVAISTGWGWRLLGIHYNLRARAAALRSEWGYEEEWEAANPGKVATPDAIALKRALMDDAMWRRPAPPRLQLRWADHAFDTTQ